MDQHKVQFEMQLQTYGIKCLCLKHQKPSKFSKLKNRRNFFDKQEIILDFSKIILFFHIVCDTYL